MALPYSTWEWLAPTILVTVWFVVPVVTIELFLSGIHNQIKDNVLRSKTTMKRLKSNIRQARELNESDEEDVGLDIQGKKSYRNRTRDSRREGGRKRDALSWWQNISSTNKSAQSFHSSYRK